MFSVNIISMDFMNLFDKFNQAFGFTAGERRVVLFLLGMLLVGAGIKMYKSVADVPPKFDYSSVDSEFTARSHLLQPADSVSNAVSNVPAAGEQRPVSKQSSSSQISPGSIDINAATKDELMKLPGIGEAMAERIILYRDEHGPFGAIDDLTKVKGIGKKKLEQIAPFCKLGK